MRTVSKLQSALMTLDLFRVSFKKRVEISNSEPEGPRVELELEVF